MTVIIEVTNEAEGRLSKRRIVLLREEFNSDEDVEAAAVAFIREAKRATEAVLQGDLP